MDSSLASILWLNWQKGPLTGVALMKDIRDDLPKDATAQFPNFGSALCCVLGECCAIGATAKLGRTRLAAASRQDLCVRLCSQDLCVEKSIASGPYVQVR